MRIQRWTMTAHLLTVPSFLGLLLFNFSVYLDRMPFDEYFIDVHESYTTLCERHDYQPYALFS